VINFLLLIGLPTLPGVLNEGASAKLYMRGTPGEDFLKCYLRFAQFLFYLPFSILPKMTARKQFLKQIGLMAGAFSANSLFNQLHAEEIKSANKKIIHLSPTEAATDEDYWTVVQQAYTVSPTIINLNNGGVSPSPRIVQEAVERYNKMTNEGPSYFMWRILDQGREPLREKLAALAGCDPGEIAINRNATEALNTVIFGLNLKAGDEVIGSKMDYPNMINAWKQRAEREGIVYKQLSFDFPIENDEAIVVPMKKPSLQKQKSSM